MKKLDQITSTKSKPHLLSSITMLFLWGIFLSSYKYNLEKNSSLNREYFQVRGGSMLKLSISMLSRFKLSWLWPRPSLFRILKTTNSSVWYLAFGLEAIKKTLMANAMFLVVQNIFQVTTMHYHSVLSFCRSDDSDHESEKSECLTRASHADVGEVS